jgi:hypothetical protein
MEYALEGKANCNGWIYFQIWQGCYGLPQAGILANTQLHGRLKAEGYHKAITTPGLWCHQWQQTQFCLLVDNFGVEYVRLQDFGHLHATLQKYHRVTTNMKGDKIVGIDIQWDFPSKQVQLDMLNYIGDLLTSLNWSQPTKPQLSPFRAAPIAYRQKPKLAPEEDASAPLSPNVSNEFRR